MQLICAIEQLPQDFKNAFIIHPYKRKGNHQACDNHRRICVLSISGKILAIVPLNHLNYNHEQGLLPETQCVFRIESGIVDTVFLTRQLQEKCQEQNCDHQGAYVTTTTRPTRESI